MFEGASQFLGEIEQGRLYIYKKTICVGSARTRVLYTE